MEKLRDLAVHLEFGKLIVIIALTSILITYLIHFILRKNPKYKLVKYIPGFIFTLIGVYNLFNIGISLPDINEFNMLLATILFIIAGLIGMLTGLIIGIIVKDKDQIKNKEKKA